METECCPPFDPAPWDGTEHEWNEKRFIKDRVRTFLYIPMNFGHVVQRVMRQVEEAQAGMPEMLCLSDHVSKWGMDIYVGVDREVPGVVNVTLSGKFVSKVYEGSFKETGKWCADFEEFLEKSGYTMKKMYLWYTTCPKCAKKYGKNYVVIVGQVA